MRQRWAKKAEKHSLETGAIEIESGDEAAASGQQFAEPSDGISFGGSAEGSNSGFSWCVLEPSGSFLADSQSGVPGFDDFDFDFQSPEGKGESDRVEARKRKSSVQIVDDATDVPLPVENSVSSSAATRRVSDLALRSTNLQQFKFPWEKGRLGRVFGSDSLVSVRPPVIEPTGYNPVSLNVQVSDNAKLTPTIKVREVAEGAATFTAVVKKIPEMNYMDERRQKRSRAIKLWWDLLATAPEASEIGRKALAEAPEDQLAPYACEVLDACFGLKSPGTLLKRFYSLKSYHDWCIAFRTAEWLPMTEPMAWEYVRWLKSESAPATKAASFMEFCRFCWFVVGVDGASLVQSSFRIKGASNQMRAAKRPWRPADLLSVEEVLKLHEILESEERHVVDRVFCGHMLHLLYGRARWSDLLATKHLYMDQDKCYLEVQTQVHKGAKAADTKSRLLPVVTPCLGISKRNWAEIYMQLRERCCLTPPMESEWHMLPAPLDDTGENWSTRYLTSEEGSEFLRLALGQAKTMQRRVSTHSLKSTAISWTSKYGVGLETRAILSRHATSLSNPTVLYSRDIIPAAMREFDKVLTDIREQWFQPDRTRSGMITPRTAMASTPKGFFARAMNAGGVLHVPEAAPVTPGLDLKLGWEDRVEDEQSLPASPSLLEGEKPLPASPALWEAGQDVSAAEDVRDVNCLEDSETSEEASEESSSSESEDDSKSVVHQLAPSKQPTSGYFINDKSSVIHCLRSGDVFRCGRKRAMYYAHIHELNGMRCSRCFNL